MDIEKYIKENRPLLARITNRIIGDKKQDFDDIYQEVCLATVKLGRLYKEDKKCKFSTYISRYAFNLANRAYKYGKHIIRPTYKNNGKITFDYEISSLDSIIYAGEQNEQSAIDFIDIGDGELIENNLDDKLRSSVIKRMLRHLTERQRTSIIRYYGLFGNKRETLVEMAKKDNITPEGTRKNIVQGIHRLSKMKEKYAEWKMTI